jgi:hypothetical protein
MPRAKKQQQRFSDGFKGFVTVNLTADDEKRIDALEPDGGRLIDSVATLVEAGYKFSSKLDANSGSIVCTLIDDRADKPTRGFALSGWGEDLINALAALCYKHFEKCDGVWPTEDAGRPISKYR